MWLDKRIFFPNWGFQHLFRARFSRCLNTYVHLNLNKFNSYHYQQKTNYFGTNLLNKYKLTSKYLQILWKLLTKKKSINNIITYLNWPLSISRFCWKKSNYLYKLDPLKRNDARQLNFFFLENKIICIIRTG